MEIVRLVIMCLISYSATACNSNSKENSKEGEVSNSMKSKIELLLYPTGCDNESCYSYKIEIENCILRVGGSYYMTFEKSKKRKQLSTSQLKKLQDFLEQIKSPEIAKSKMLTNGTWEAKLLINGKIYYLKEGFSFESPPKKIKRLINYIVKLSPLEIELYGFS